MITIQKDKSKAIASLEDECFVLEEQIAALISAVELGEKLLDELTKPEIALFIARWSRSEMDRLANLRMTIPVDDHDKNVIITAQYDAAKNFGSHSDEIEENLNQNRRILDRAREALAGKRNKLAKLKE